MDNTQTRSGFVALIGPPNAGKSTLMNQMVGQKVSIVTPKVQTTRSRIRGIAMKGTSQMVFVDTPGIFTPKRRLDRAMVHAAWQGADDGDVLLLLHDCARKVIDDDTLAILAKIKEQKLTVSLILNKTDLATPEKLLTRTKALSDEYDFEKIFMVSAEYGHGVEDVKSWLAEKMPLSPYLFDPEDLSDLPQRLLAAEVLREKLFLNLHQELPYQMTVETDSWEEKRMAVPKSGCLFMCLAKVIAALCLVRAGRRCAGLGNQRGLNLKRRSIGASIFLPMLNIVKTGWMIKSAMQIGT